MMAYCPALDFNPKENPPMKFETILAIVKSTDSDYLKSARIFDAVNTPTLAGTTAPPVAGNKVRRKRGPNKPKTPPAATVGHLNGNHETAGE